MSVPKHPRSMAKPVQSSVCRAALPARFYKNGRRKEDKTMTKQSSVPTQFFPSSCPGHDVSPVCLLRGESQLDAHHPEDERRKNEYKIPLSFFMDGVQSPPKQSRGEGTQRTVHLPLQIRRADAACLHQKLGITL